MTTPPIPNSHSMENNPPLTSMPSMPPPIENSLLTPSPAAPTDDTRQLPTPTKDVRTDAQKRTTSDGKYIFEITKSTTGDDIKIMRLDGKNYPDGRNYFLVSEIAGKKLTLQVGPEPYWQSNTELVLVPQQDLVRVVNILNAERKTIGETPAGS